MYNLLSFNDVQESYEEYKLMCIEQGGYINNDDTHYEQWLNDNFVAVGPDNIIKDPNDFNWNTDKGFIQDNCLEFVEDDYNKTKIELKE